MKGLKSKNFLLLLAGILFFLLLYNTSFFGNKKAVMVREDNSSIVKDIPEGWMIKLADESDCFEVGVFNKGKFDEDLKSYIKTKVYGGLDPGKIEDINTYNINSPEVIDLGSQGVGNKNTIYVKTKTNVVYMIEINLTTKELTKKNEASSCVELLPLVQSLVNSLL